jgi:hypothetical protein
VSAQSNAIYGDTSFGNAVLRSLPAGTTSFLVSVTGEAYWGAGRSFGGLLVGHHVSPDYEIIAVHVDETVLLQHTGADPRLEIYFADDDATDNSGGFEVTVSPDTGDPLVFTVDASAHCLSLARAASVSLTSGPCAVGVSGSPWFGGTGRVYRSVALVYDTSLSQVRTFATVPVGSNLLIPDIAEGTVRVFFVDISRQVSDNGGEVQVSFSCETTVPVTSWTWSGLKGVYRE